MPRSFAALSFRQPGRRGWVGRSLRVALSLGLLLAAGSGVSLSPSASVDEGLLPYALAESVVSGTQPAPLLPLAPRPSRPGQGHALAPMEAMEHAPFVELGAMDSEPGESVDEFLVRVAQAMDVFTRRTHHEACAVIMSHTTEQAWRVRMTTNRSHLSCTMVEFEEPGFVRWGPDIHSHPRVPGGIRVNSQDVLRNPSFKCGQTAIVFDEKFSGRDLDRGPGYLVSRGRLLFQKGRDYPFRQLATFEPLQSMPSLTVGDALDLGEVVAQAAADAAWLNEETDSLPEGYYPHTHCEAPDSLDTEELTSAPGSALAD